MRMNNLKKNKIIKEELKKMKGPSWIDENKFKEILDSNAFDYKNEINIKNY